MITQSEAIALQIRPWSKTSHIVTWLTPDHGRLITSIKGACRPKSPFLGQYDLFYTCHLLFYTREHEGVHIAKECEPHHRRDTIREHWRAAALATYLVELTARALPLREPHADVYKLLSQTLDYLAEHPQTSLVECLIRYELHLLYFLGLLPDLSPCETCHQPHPEWFSFSLSTGRLRCHHTGHHPVAENTISLHPSIQEAYTLLRNKVLSGRYPLHSEASPAKKNGGKSKLPLGLSRFLGIFITSHLDLPAAVRRVTLELIETTQTQQIASQETQQP
jgi:DNA repair protein RecO